MYQLGLVIGKFYPPHRGHKYLIDTAMAQVERLAVVVCDIPGQTIPATLRAAWLQEMHPRATVLVIDDRDDEQDSRIWAEHTRSLLGSAPDVVFSSEDYGDAYATFLGATHIQVDRERRRVPCSGTAIRADPLTHWDCLEPCVRAYFVKRICLVGAESTGKTTLARALAEHYGTIWVPEYGRDYAATKLQGSTEGTWRPEEFLHVAAEQVRREDRAARAANRLLICDTDALATSIWHERYLGTRAAAMDALVATRHYDLYLVTDIDTPFVQDGTRDGEHIRHWMHTRFLEELDRQQRHFALVAGSREERMATATRHIDAILASTQSGSASTVDTG
jgi:NadR type nicotinamide-nucleotide adenylyltransferase